MFQKLIEYKAANDGSVEIPEGAKGSVTLRRWLLKQCQEYHNHANLTTEQIERLEGLGVQLPPSWDDMYDRLAAHRATTGTLDDVTKDSGEQLHSWVKAQKITLVKHFQGEPTVLPKEKVNKLKTLGYAPSRPNIIRPGGIIDGIAAEANWNAMLRELEAYKERHGGSMTFPEHCPERALKYWATEQRREFKLLRDGKPSNLTAQRMQRLTAIGFDATPGFEHVPWEERVAALRSYAEEHGHCRPPISHPELGIFVSYVRQQHKKKGRGEKTKLTDEQMNELAELGFVFQAGKTPKVRSLSRKSWDERFQDLLEFKEVHGHTVVPQLSGPLGDWVRMQRVEYKRMKSGRASRMTAERALRLTEIGFCFDASARFSGSKSNR